jgi:carbon storage regulator
LPALVVTRRPGESIVIELPSGELIDVVVLSVKSNQVKLGTNAPKHLPVVREELLRQLSDEALCDSWKGWDVVAG